MTETGGSRTDRREAGRYEIRIQGHLETRWAGWFDGLSLIHDSDGTTVIRGPVVDQAALHGLLQRVRDIGLPLVSVTHVGPNQANSEPHLEGQQDEDHRLKSHSVGGLLGHGGGNPVRRDSADPST
jgi:hypothetical protein